MADNTADADRLVQALCLALDTKRVAVDLHLLRRLPAQLRNGSFRARCVMGRERGFWRLLDILDPNLSLTAAGLAVDLGTSRVALRLLDLNSNTVLGESAFNNPQIESGPDVLSRIHAAALPGGLKALNQAMVSALNRAISALCDQCDLPPKNIYLAAVAGNTTMTHLFMGLEPRWIIREPYIPAVNKPGSLRATDLGLSLNAAARVFIFPNIGSYFGGDLIAGILYSGLHRRQELSLLVDVGTNAEVVLGNRHWLIACAGAAGPALEGGVTRMGMMAAPGVIDRVSMDPDSAAFDVHTIGGLPPTGICGSGLIDLAAVLFLSGMIDIRGKFIPGACKNLLKEKKGLQHLVVVAAEQSAVDRDLEISQADLDSLIRSKAAMYTILETLSTTVGVSLSDIKTLYVAGTFGVLIDPDSAVAIGMMPDLPRSRFRTLGNSSLGGAARALKNPGALEEIDAIRDRITYLELNVNQEFMNRFSAAKFLPHTDRSRFPSVAIP